MQVLNSGSDMRLPPDELSQVPSGSIIATGLYKEIYELVDVKYSSTYGYSSTMDGVEQERIAGRHIHGKLQRGLWLYGCAEWSDVRIAFFTQPFK